MPIFWIEVKHLIIFSLKLINQKISLNVQSTLFCLKSIKLEIGHEFYWNNCSAH
jgi:hypothetical protein